MAWEVEIRKPERNATKRWSIIKWRVNWISCWSIEKDQKIGKKRLKKTWKKVRQKIIEKIREKIISERRSKVS